MHGTIEGKNAEKVCRWCHAGAAGRLQSIWHQMSIELVVKTVEVHSSSELRYYIYIYHVFHYECTFVCKCVCLYLSSFLWFCIYIIGTVWRWHCHCHCGLKGSCGVLWGSQQHRIQCVAEDALSLCRSSCHWIPRQHGGLSRGIARCCPLFWESKRKAFWRKDPPSFRRDETDTFGRWSSALEWRKGINYIVITTLILNQEEKNYYRPQVLLFWTNIFPITRAEWKCLLFIARIQRKSIIFLSNIRQILPVVKYATISSSLPRILF